VEDHCRGIMAALENGESGGVYNIGARNPRRNLDVAKSVLEALGKPQSLLTFVVDRPGHDRRYAIDPSFVETELNWRPTESWESGLAKTIQWYQDNSIWIQRVRNKEYLQYYRQQYGNERKTR